MVRPLAILVLSLVQAAAPAVIFAGTESVGQVLGSESTRTRITPAGWAFSIWGVIYAWSIAFGVYQLVQRDRRVVQRLGWLPAAVFVGNALWLVVARAALLWGTVVVILGLLLALVGVVWIASREREPGNAGELAFVELPFGLYLGWVTMATFANVAAALAGSGFRGGPIPETAWAAVVLALASALAVFLFLRLRRNPAFAAAVLWALAGIAAG